MYLVRYGIREKLIGSNGLQCWNMLLRGNLEGEVMRNTYRYFLRACSVMYLMIGNWEIWQGEVG